MKRLNLNKALRIFFSNAVKITLANPGQALSFLKTLKWMAKAARLRAKWKKLGVHVPPIIIFSVTHQCNMECRGCYNRTFHGDDEDEIGDERLRGIVQEAKELGVSFFVIAGGEPFMRPALLEITQDFPQMIFLVFTNGVLIQEREIRALKQQKHVIPLVSLEGRQEDTDQRRGEGTFTAVHAVLSELKREGIFFGTSLTLTRHNLSTILDLDYIRELVDARSRFFLFLEYTPTEEGTEDWVLSQAQRDRVPELLESYRKRFPALFIGVPWDEEEVGGCLSAGRGFVHISARGDLEPCPFAPFSDANLKQMSLRDGLRSEFLKEIRRRPELATETGGGCVLWKERELVADLLESQGGKRAGPA